MTLYSLMAVYTLIFFLYVLISIPVHIRHIKRTQRIEVSLYDVQTLLKELLKKEKD